LLLPDCVEFFLLKPMLKGFFNHLMVIFFSDSWKLGLGLSFLENIDIIEQHQDKFSFLIVNILSGCAKQLIVNINRFLICVLALLTHFKLFFQLLHLCSRLSWRLIYSWLWGSNHFWRFNHAFSTLEENQTEIDIESSSGRGFHIWNVKELEGEFHHISETNFKF
jgi:hypothetical protein